MKLHTSLYVWLLLLLPLVQVYSNNIIAQGSDGFSTPHMPTYVGISKNYDNRKCVVTISLDDFGSNSSAWQNCLSMLTRKRLCHTIGIVTNSADWNYTQYWLNQGYTEAASHSRSHADVPYSVIDPYTNKFRGTYEWQINGSKQDIIGNLSLPWWWRNGQKQYVYVWIDPYGRSDSTVRHLLGICHYLLERGACTSPSSDPVAWDSDNNLFGQIGLTIEVGPRFGGETSVLSLNGRFDRCYNEGQVYHFIAHPGYVNWSKGGYADQHTDHISGKRDVWYVPLGLLSLYRLFSTRNVTQVTRVENQTYGAFKMSIDKNVHEMYGASYPMTYVFKIPSNWTNGCVYYRYLERAPWKLLVNEKSINFFNGIEAARFNFSAHEVYVSVAFRSTLDSMYLKILPSPIRTAPSFPRWNPCVLLGCLVPR